MSALELEVINPEAAAGIDFDMITAVVAAANTRAAELGLPGGAINVNFCDDRQMQSYNREFSGNDYPTDVLSFSYIEDGQEAIDGVVGEMVISYETALRQARDNRLTLSNEVAILVLHGILHIAGYDHAAIDERDRMQELQREIITAAGLSYRDFAWTD